MAECFFWLKYLFKKHVGRGRDSNGNITLEEGERQIYHPMISRTRNDAARTFGKDRKTERTCMHWKARSRFWEKAYALNRPTGRHAFARISIPVQFFSTLFLKGSTNVTWAAADIMMQEASVPLLYTLKPMQRQWQSSSSSAVVLTSPVTSSLTCACCGLSAVSAF